MPEGRPARPASAPYGEAMTDNRLGEYLKARRGLVGPADAGVPDLGRRRVPGLRREEVALIAGISAYYYLRLEQGRDKNPSPQVLDAIARALRLDEHATAYLHELAQPPRRGTDAPRAPEHVPPGILQALESWEAIPACVQNPYMDVLAANPLAQALSPGYRPGGNLARAAFLDDTLRRLYDGWDEMAARAVAGLRALTVDRVDDPHLAELVEDLRKGSAEFERLWQRHDASPPPSGRVDMTHPVVGPLHLRYDRLAIIESPGLLLVLHQAEPGSPSETALTRLV
jgi:transcriptional regulator with XRE-family HTH domain